MGLRRPTQCCTLLFPLPPVSLPLPTPRARGCHIIPSSRCPARPPLFSRSASQRHTAGTGTVAGQARSPRMSASWAQDSQGPWPSGPFSRAVFQGSKPSLVDMWPAPPASRVSRACDSPHSFALPCPIGRPGNFSDGGEKGTAAKRRPYGYSLAVMAGSTHVLYSSYLASFALFDWARANNGMTYLRTPYSV